MPRKFIPFKKYSTSAGPVPISPPCSCPVVQVAGGTFYRAQLHSEIVTPKTASSLFPNLNFSIPSSTSSLERWAIIGPASAGKTTFLELLRGQHLCLPPIARSYPYLASKEVAAKDPRLRNPTRAIQYVGFSSEQAGSDRVGAKGSYLSARYESRKEDTDFTLLDHLRGNTSLNAAPSNADPSYRQALESLLAKTIQDLKLENLVDMPLSNLSNGQTRRAMIARALLVRPELLLLDEPFMGLDPATLGMLSLLLRRLADSHSPRIMLALRPQDTVPEWITHIIYLGPNLQVQAQGEKIVVLGKPPNKRINVVGDTEPGFLSEKIKQFAPHISTEAVQDPKKFRFHNGQITRKPDYVKIHLDHRECLAAMNGVRVSYGSKTVLGGWKQNIEGNEREGLWWKVARGDHWGIFGPNGSGKTTILSLICSDHPQTYSLPIELFGRSRLPKPGEPGISIFDLQARIGHSSPEIHAFFPRNLSLKRTLESAWADTFIGKPNIGPKGKAAVSACLDAFRSDLASSNPLHGRDWTSSLRFGDLPFSAQRVALFLRAIVKTPDIVILDEAFSGMDAILRNKCMMHLAGWLGPDQALICVSHLKEEVPPSVRRWMCLPDELGAPPRFGKLGAPLRTQDQWDQVWGIRL